jgi:hypothetical protein
MGVEIDRGELFLRQFDLAPQRRPARVTVQRLEDPFDLCQ